MASKKYIVCIDTSGSMSGNKIQDAKTTALRLYDQGDQKENSLYHFQCQVYGPISRKEFEALGCPGGTSIQPCLFDLFNNKLPNELNGTRIKYTEFWFITDAEDQIDDEKGLINAKKQCETKYSQSGKKLYCKEFIVGNGGCREALSRIFVGGHFEGGAEDLQRLLKEAEEQTRKSNAAQQECDQMGNTLTNLSFSTEKEVNESMRKIEEIEKKVDAVKKDVESVENAVTIAKTEYQTLVTEHEDVKSLVENAKTEKEIEKAEDKGFELSEKYSTLILEVNNAQKKANEAMQKLIEAQTQAHKQQSTTQNNYNKISGKFQQVKSKINGLLNRLQNVTSQQSKDIKKEVKKQLQNVRKILEDAGKPTQKLFKMQKQMMKWFRSIQKPQNDLKQMKAAIESKIQDVDNLMDELDDK